MMPAWHVCLVLLHCVLPCLVDNPGKPALFLKEMEEQFLWGRRDVIGY